MLISPLLPARVNPLFRHPAERRMSLDGAWQFALDPNDGGRAARWFAHPEALQESIQVPGCWQGQGFGGEGKDTVWDFQLSARTFRASYTGTGWYARAFTIPAAWEGARLWLNFGGVHPSAEVWVNGEWVGKHDLPFVPFSVEITGVARAGASNDVVVRVHERHREFGLFFDWQGNWSGLYRGVELSATGAHCIRECALYPDVASGMLGVKLDIDGQQRATALTLRMSVYPGEAAPRTGSAMPPLAPIVAQECSLPRDGNVSIPIPSPRLWSPDTPNLYRVELALLEGEEILDALSERTGFVGLSTAGKHLQLNGEPYYLRGTGDFVSCPETGCPDTDRARWREKLQALRAYGYNYVRCQSYVYGPEYYDIADEVGLLVQSEMGMLGACGGASQMHGYQWPKPTPDNYPILKRHWELVVRRDVNHPSANLYCMSNEYGATPHFPRIAWECYRATKAIKPSAFVIWTDGGYSPDMPGDFVNDEASRDAEVALPLIQHEFRWWSSFPDVRIKEQYAGALRPYAIEIAEEAARRHGLEHLLPRFAEASQRLQFLEAKLKMEECRRNNPTLAGICHFNAMDTNLSPQGIINEFYQRKYADSARWQQTNGDTVLLCSLGTEQRVLTAGTRFGCTLSVSDFAHPPLHAPQVDWRLCDQQRRTLAEGTLSYAHTPYCTCPAGEIAVTLPEVAQPATLTLHAQLREDGREITNEWPLWLFPASGALPTGIFRYGDTAASWLRDWAEIPARSALEDAATSLVLTDLLDDRLEAYLHAGGRVLLAASEGLVRPHPPNFGYINYFFTPPANYPTYEDGQNGTLITDHPMLGEFPHEGFADLNWFRLIDLAPPLDLEPLGLLEGEPVLRVIHRYPVCRPLGYLHEVSVGAGRLLLCGLTLSPEWPEARYLLAQLCAYLAGPALVPAPMASTETMARLKSGTALTRIAVGVV